MGRRVCRKSSLRIVTWGRPANLPPHPPGGFGFYQTRHDPAKTLRQPCRDQAVARPDLVDDVVRTNAGPIQKMVDQPRSGEVVLGIADAAVMNGCHGTVPFKDQDTQKCRTARWLVRL